jgi:hypothetical protein
MQGTARDRRRPQTVEASFRSGRETPEVGEVVEVVEAGGLYRHYERVAA